MSEVLKELVHREQAANMYQRFAKAKEKCAVMQKRGNNDFQNYKYVMESDVVSLVNDACNQNGLIWVCSYHDFRDSLFTSDKGKTNIRTSCRCELQVIDAESGQVIIKTESFGDSLDTSDKSIYKSQTGAKKYALMSTFGIATYDDPEKDSPLHNESVKNKLTGEKPVFKYFITDSKLEENPDLAAFVRTYKDFITYSDTMDATITVDKEIKKLERYLVKAV
jgi:hypothetical protein